MDKARMLTSLAENGYNVSFGAKKHFATYDIVEKIPGFLALVSLLIGVWQIYAPSFKYNPEVSLLLIFTSIIVLTITPYVSDNDKYKDIGTRLIIIHNKLKSLYYQVQSSSLNDFPNEEIEMNLILSEYYQINITKQILMSDWYAHYKFFYQAQHEWIDEQKKFTWKDKFPVSLRFALAVVFIIVIILITIFIIWLLHKFPSILGGK